MRLVLDTSILIAYLKADEAVSPLARTVIHGYLGSERNEGVLSTLSAGEVLVVPNRDGAAREVALDIMDMPGLQLRSVDFLVAAEAARIRAEASLPLPDAVVIATGFLSNAQILVTNDRRLATAAPQVVPEMAVVLLSDLV
jgi:predicted nucleic acid-binding protein